MPASPWRLLCQGALRRSCRKLGSERKATLAALALASSRSGLCRGGQVQRHKLGNGPAGYGFALAEVAVLEGSLARPHPRCNAASRGSL